MQPRLFMLTALCSALVEQQLLKMAQNWSVTLNTGAKMPAFGLGTWQSKKGEVGAAVEVAVKAGYRNIDTAHMYFNEAEIGEALQKCFKEGVVKREDLFITTKLAMWHHDDPVAAVQLSLKALQLDYLDLFLVHTPSRLRKGASLANLTDDDKLNYSEEDMATCWKGMEECVSKGFTRAIGISNFSITKTENILKTAKIVPAVNQVECHPYFQQNKLKQYCDSKGITIMAYGPIGSPSRINKSDTDPIVMEDPVIKEIAEKYKSTPAQVCISFALHRGFVVIPKTVNPMRVTENLKSTELKLDAEDMRRLKDINKDFRLFHGKTFLPPSATFEQAWDIEADEKFEIK